MAKSHCSGPHNIGGMTPIYRNGQIIPGYQVHCYRVINGKYLNSEINNKVFLNSEEANKEIINKGYGSWYYPRASVVLPLFATLPAQIAQAKFDALYRLYKWTGRQKDLPNKYNKVLNLRKKLTKLAKKVSIFHPCAKFFTAEANTSK